jgi:hypothetical protein
MILIDTATFSLREFPTSDQRYAILSHTWGLSIDEEVTYEEMVSSERSAATLAKPGYSKVIKTCEIARSNYNLPYAWIDTCCINKASSAELSEAINSMFKWYRDAWVCLVYLSDVIDTQLSFHQSRWFTRGWTLQELIAPMEVIFFDSEWAFRGTKESMATHIATITGIPSQILDHSADLNDVPVAQRFSWAALRETTRDEDRAYSLMGLFDINMAMLYGEGRKAFIRLQEQILSQTADMSLFLWNDLQTREEYTGLLAPSPDCFREMRTVNAKPTFTQRDFHLTNRGIRLKVGLAWEADTGLAILPVKHSLGSTGNPAGIYLRRVGLDLFARARPQDYATIEGPRHYTVFTTVRTLTQFQSKSIANLVIRVSIPSDISVVKVEPRGSWNPSAQLLHSSHTGAFLGYMMFRNDHEPDYHRLNEFAVVFCFRHGQWSATAVDWPRWSKIQGSFYNYYKDHLDEMSYNDTIEDMEIGHIVAPRLTSVTVHLRGGVEPSVDIRNIYTR